MSSTDGIESPTLTMMAGELWKRRVLGHEWNTVDKRRILGRDAGRSANIQRQVLV